MKNSNINRDLI